LVFNLNQCVSVFYNDSDLVSVYMPWCEKKYETSLRTRAISSRISKSDPASPVFEKEKTMTSWNVRVSICILFAGWLAVGCNLGPGGNATGYQPLLFPLEGQLGDTSAGTTVAMIVDSNYIEGSDLLEIHDLHKARVQVLVSDPVGGGWTDAPANVRSVFPIQAPSNTLAGQNRPGLTATIVLFDLPSASALNNPSSFPLTVLLKLLIDGQEDLSAEFNVLGASGTATNLIEPMLNLTLFGLQSPLGQLAPQPMIRLRGKRGAGKFEASQPKLGAIEFLFTWDRTCINIVRPYPATEAADATALIGPSSPVDGIFRSAKIALIHPAGFRPKYLASASGTLTADETLAGTGPFLDLGFGLKGNSLCSLDSPNIFSISDFRVYDISGNVVIESASVEVDTAGAPSNSALLRKYPVTIPPPISGGC